MLNDTSGILIDLDCLYDTRLATLKGLDDKYVGMAITAGYRERVTDNLVELIPDLDMAAYKELYEKRDIPTIVTAASFPTAIIIELGLVVREHIKMASRGPMAGTPVVTINTYPYKLTKEEIDTIVAALKHDLDEPLCRVTAISMPPEQLTPSLLSSRYPTVFMYHLSHWMRIHENSIKVLAPIDMVVFAPKLYITGRLNTISDYQLLDGINIGALVSELHMQYFRLELLDAGRFSFIDMSIFKNVKKR
jgi:hypothetical protein